MSYQTGTGNGLGKHLPGLARKAPEDGSLLRLHYELFLGTGVCGEGTGVRWKGLRIAAATS